MQIHLYDSAAQVGQAAATLIAAQIIAKPDSVLGLATGSTPIPTYQELIRLCKGGVLDFSRVRSFNLDEYCNLPVDHEQSYHSFMRQQLFDHINIDPANTRVPDGNARDQAAECASYDTAINQAGGIDPGAGHRPQRPHRLQRTRRYLRLRLPYRQPHPEHHRGQPPLL